MRSGEALLKCHRPDLVHRPGDGTLLRAVDIRNRPNLQSPFVGLALQLHFLKDSRSHLRIIRREMDGVCGD